MKPGFQIAAGAYFSYVTRAIWKGARSRFHFGMVVRDENMLRMVAGGRRIFKADVRGIAHLPEVGGVGAFSRSRIATASITLLDISILRGSPLFLSSSCQGHCQGQVNPDFIRVITRLLSRFNGITKRLPCCVCGL